MCSGCISRRSLGIPTLQEYPTKSKNPCCNHKISLMPLIKSIYWRTSFLVGSVRPVHPLKAYKCAALLPPSVRFFVVVKYHKFEKQLKALISFFSSESWIDLFLPKILQKNISTINMVVFNWIQLLCSNMHPKFTIVNRGKSQFQIPTFQNIPKMVYYKCEVLYHEDGCNICDYSSVCFAHIWLLKWMSSIYF